mgnify:CR=1 FL=1
MHKYALIRNVEPFFFVSDLHLSVDSQSIFFGCGSKKEDTRAHKECRLRLRPDRHHSSSYPR